MKQHTMSCEYPEGCSCGASKWIKLKKELDYFRDSSPPKNLHSCRFGHPCICDDKCESKGCRLSRDK